MDFVVKKFYLVFDELVKFFGGNMFEEIKNIEVLEEMKIMIVSINVV